MILALDVGNSRTKWGIYGLDGHQVRQGNVDNAALAALASQRDAWANCRCAVVSHVAGENAIQPLRELLATLKLPVRWVKATAAACGVTNRYALPQQLGSDRWAAAVAAWNLTQAPCIIANAGTALTVDALSSRGEFLGGLIVPGLTLMQAALAQGAANLSETVGRWGEYPDNTADAIHCGALHAMAGAVERMRAQLSRREGRAPRCLLAGGDAALLAEALHNAVEHIDDLVLQGLVVIEKDSV